MKNKDELEKEKTIEENQNQEEKQKSSNMLFGFFDWLLSRKILVSVLNVFVIVGGVLCFFMLDWKQAPTSNRPILTISTRASFGSHIDMFENEITKKVEEAVGQVSGVDYFSSETKSGESDVTVYFREEVDPTEAANRIRGVVSSIAKELPSYAKYPTISTGEKDNAIVDVLFYENRSDIESNKETTKEGKDKLRAIQNYIENDLKQRVLNIEGVSSVIVYGSADEEIYVQLDLNKVQKLKIGIVEIRRIISQAISFSQNNPMGKIIVGAKKYEISSTGNTRAIQDIENIEVVPGVLVKDIATVKVKQKLADIFFNGSNPAVHLRVNKSSTGNPLETVKKVKKLIKKQLSERKDIKFNVVNRLSTTNQLFKKVKQTGWEALLLVFLIVLLFTFSFRASLVPLTAVPISIIATFISMKFFNLSFNSATLSALVLSIGLVVDDAIVILENIHKKIKEGFSPFKAAVAGTAELCLPIILMTLTLAFVFLPTVFGEGPTRYDMKEFAIVISSAVIFSGINSLTLSPVLSYLIMAKHKDNPWHQRFMKAVDNFYNKLLCWIFKFKYLFVTIITGLFILAIFTARTLQSEIKPTESNSRAAIVGRVLRQEDALQQKSFDKVISDSSAILSQYVNKEIKFFYINVQNGRLQIDIELHKHMVTKKNEFIDSLIKKLSEINQEVNFSLTSESLERSINFSVTGEKDPQDLYVLGMKLIDALKNEKMIEEGSVWYSMQNTDNFNFTVDFNKIQKYNLDADRIKEMMSILFHNITLGETTFTKSNKSYKTWIGVQRDFKFSPERILQMSFLMSDKRDSEKANYINLGSVVTVDTKRSLSNKTRFMGHPSISFTCGISKNTTIGSLVEKIQKLQGTYLPFGTRVEFTKEARDYLNSKGNLQKMIIFAIICIFLILAAQFESLLDAFLTLMTAPLAFIGAVFIMKAFGLTINVFTIIGLITLTGLITKHGILFVSTANSLAPLGLSIFQTICKAAVLRLNPVLMTTFAMILGSVPLAVTSSAATVALKQMSIVIIGGITIGTIMTLFLIPILYYFTKRRNWNKVKNSKKQ